MSRSVLHIHWALAPTTGGVESHLADLGRLQAERGWRVTFLTGEPEPIRHPAYEIISTPLLDLEKARNSDCSARLSATEALIENCVVTRNVDVVHGHNLHHFSAAPALAVDALRRRLGLRAHHTFHETWPDVLTDRPVYRGWEGSYAISQFIQQECGRLIGFTPDLLSPGIDTARFRSTRMPFSHQSTPIIFHPARLLPWKGVHVSVAALRLLLDAGHSARLVLTDTQRIADWDEALPAYRRRIMSMIEDLDLSEHVTFVQAAYSDMPRLYNEADIVVYPTIKDEPFGLVPPEAMSSGRPVVAARCGGIVETVDHGVTGFLVEPDDPHDLADAIAALLSDQGKAREMGEKGRRRVESRFSVTSYIRELEMRYEHRCEPSPAASRSGV